MKKFGMPVLIAVILGALWTLPFRGSDVAELLPVETVIVSRSGPGFVVDAGVGVLGRGGTAAAALKTLREEASVELFFRTAEQIVITESAADSLAEVVWQQDFRPGAGVYLTPVETPDAEAIGRYLAAHDSNTTLTDVRAALLAGEKPRVPVIVPVDGGYLVYA